MKKFRFLTLIAAIVATSASFTACDDDDHSADNPIPESGTRTLAKGSDYIYFLSDGAFKIESNENPKNQTPQIVVYNHWNGSRIALIGPVQSISDITLDKVANNPASYWEKRTNLYEGNGNYGVGYIIKSVHGNTIRYARLFCPKFNYTKTTPVKFASAVIQYELLPGKYPVAQ